MISGASWGKMKKGVKKMTEHDEQIKVCQWVKRNHPKLKFFAIPNAGKRGMIAAAKLKAEGMSAGVPDLYFPVLDLWIELKFGKGRVTPAQKGWIDYLNGIGHTAIVCYGSEAAINALEDALRGKDI